MDLLDTLRTFAAGLVVVAACGSSGPSTVFARAKVGYWMSGDPCEHGELVIFVNTEDHAVVSALGFEEAAPSGYVELDLPAEAIGDRTSIPIRVQVGTRVGEVTVEVPKPPPRRGKLDNGGPRSLEAWGGKAVASYAATERSSAWENRFDMYGRVDEAGRLEFTYTGCLIGSGKSSLGDFELRGPTELVHRIPLDAAFAAVTPGEGGKRALPIALTIESSDGVLAQLTLEGTLAVDQVARSLFADTRDGKGIASAPAYRRGTGQAFAQFVAIDRPMIQRGALTDVAVVAWSTPTNPRDSTPCGPYMPPAGGAASYLRREIVDQTVTVREARTGAKLGEKTFAGREPACPRSTLGMKGITTGWVSGGAPSGPMLTWIAATAR